MREAERGAPRRRRRPCGHSSLPPPPCPPPPCARSRHDNRHFNTRTAAIIRRRQNETLTLYKRGSLAKAKAAEGEQVSKGVPLGPGRGGGSCSLSGGPPGSHHGQYAGAGAEVEGSYQAAPRRPLQRHCPLYRCLIRCGTHNRPASSSAAQALQLPGPWAPECGEKPPHLQAARAAQLISASVGARR